VYVILSKYAWARLASGQHVCPWRGGGTLRKRSTWPPASDGTQRDAGKRRKGKAWHGGIGGTTGALAPAQLLPMLG
jgi:hypothetical protein